ncbi:MAG: hypothetical protein DLM61_06280 [Pseudonocardiales bacterium]|nr:MAG: hypothetical protein DLM61_06280 [Pseudonocardiales bacterium]
MSLTREDRRWEVLARELPFQQITALRAQAEGWRNGTAATVTILAAVAVAKGRNDIAQLDTVWRWIIVSAVVLGFAALVTSLMISVRVAHGSPGASIWNTGKDLEEWTRNEVARGGRLLTWAVRLAAGGLSLLIVAMAAGWLAPATEDSAAQLVQVRASTEAFCGHLIAIRDGVVTVDTGTADAPHPRSVAVPALTELNQISSC